MNRAILKGATVALLGGGALHEANAIPPEEWEALIALYESTDGDHWTTTTSGHQVWGVGSGIINPDPCTWYGVLCENDRVVALDLGGNGLHGQLPPELGQLPHLRMLFLGGNRLYGEIPSELGNLAKLEILLLSRNELSGKIPSELGQLAKLQWLYLYKNHLSGEIPSELGQLAELERLYLYENHLSGEIPSELGQLAKLERLSLQNNELEGPIPPELGQFPVLGELQLGGNKLNGPVPVELAELEALWSLSLYWNALSLEENVVFKSPTVQAAFSASLLTQVRVPTHFQVLENETTATTAVIRWDPSPTTPLVSGGYMVVITLQGDTEPSQTLSFEGLTTSRATISNLLPKTSYEVSIRSYADPHDTWSSSSYANGNPNTVYSHESASAMIRTEAAAGVNSDEEGEQDGGGCGCTTQPKNTGAPFSTRRTLLGLLVCLIGILFYLCREKARRNRIAPQI